VVVVDDGGAVVGVSVRDGRCRELRMPTGKKASTRPISRPNRRAAIRTRERVDCVVMVMLCLGCGGVVGSITRENGSGRRESCFVVLVLW